MFFHNSSSSILNCFCSYNKLNVRYCDQCHRGHHNLQIQYTYSYTRMLNTCSLKIIILYSPIFFILLKVLIVFHCTCTRTEYIVHPFLPQNQLINSIKVSFGVVWLYFFSTHSSTVCTEFILNLYSCVPGNYKNN